MPGPIITNSGAIRGTATKFQAASTQTAALVTSMQRLSDSLGGTWRGVAYIQFQAAMGQAKAQLDVAVRDLQETGQSLTEAAQAYEQFEQTARSQVSV